MNHLLTTSNQEMLAHLKKYHLAPTLLSLSIQERIVWPRPFLGRLPSLHGINIMSCSFYTVNAICPKNKINKNAIMKWTQLCRPAPMCSYDFDQIKCKPMFETPKIFIDGPFKTSGLPTLRLRETPDAFETTILTLRTGHLFFV